MVAVFSGLPTKKQMDIQTVQTGGFLSSDQLQFQEFNTFAPTSNVAKTFAPTVTDARQISIITNSPQAQLTTKKSDTVSPSVSPSQTGSVIPITATPEQSSTGGLLGTILPVVVVAGLGFAGYQILKKGKGGKK